MSGPTANPHRLQSTTERSGSGGLVIYSVLNYSWFRMCAFDEDCDNGNEGGVTAMADLRAGYAKRLSILTAAAFLETAEMAMGQETVRLTLDEAIELARENNPAFLQTQNNEAQFDWGVRQATSNLFVPSLTASGGLSYRAPGINRIGTITTGSSGQGAQYGSRWGLSLGYSLNGNTLFGLSSAKANQNVARARTDDAEFTMESLVTLQYMAALRARDRVQVDRRQVERSLEDLEIAQARVDAQAAVVTDATAARVQVGRDSVALLRAESDLRVETLRLLEGIGLDLGADVELVSQFEVFLPSWTTRELISIALESHPGLEAAVAAEGAGRAGLRQARGQYFPSVSLSAGWSGFTQVIQNGDFNVAIRENGVAGAIANCNTFNSISSGLSTPLPDFPRDCSGIQLTDEDRQAILDRNDVFPFGFTAVPFGAGLSVSIPIFNGFSRERQVSQAANTLEDAVYARRGKELQLRTNVTSALDALMTAFSVVQVEERSRVLAAEQLEMWRTRYGLGADNFLVLLDAERTMAEGERAYLDSLYTFYVQLATLENAVGQRLRPEE